MVHLAIDIGASSGRHILGWTEDGVLRTKEVYRFPNGVKTENGHAVWDLNALETYVIEGVRAAFREQRDIRTLSVDTWGVDYVLLKDGKPLLPAYAYRDSRTEDVIEKVHARLPFDVLYAHTGCQFQPFNTLYQLADDQLAGRLDQADALLMIPEYLLWKLTGVMKREYTNASTTGLLSAKDGEYDAELIKMLGFPQKLFPKLDPPGTVLGPLKEEIAGPEGTRCTAVLCATHDTASAVEGIPMDVNAPYISSGTWSLLGIKTPHALTDAASMQQNWSNEGGVGYNRYQKNIMGMWLINRLRDELTPGLPFPEVVRLAQESAYDGTVNADDSAFLNPDSMKAAFDSAAEGLQAPGDYFRCAYLSLAQSYRRAIAELEENTGEHYDRLYIVGGGAKNAFLNRLTEEAIERRVIALPIEATALGNLKMQMKEGTSC